MLHQQWYVSEKLDELARDEARRRDCFHEQTDVRPPRTHHRRPRLVAPVARGAGRRLRRVGEALEAWATSPAVRSH